MATHEHREDPKSYSREGRKRHMPLRHFLRAWPHAGWWMPAIPTYASASCDKVYCWLFSVKDRMVLLTPPILESMTDWAKSVTLLLLAQATQAHCRYGSSVIIEFSRDYSGLGAHDAQTSHPFSTLSRDGILLKVGMGCLIRLFGAYSLIPPTTCLGGVYI